MASLMRKTVQGFGARDVAPGRMDIASWQSVIDGKNVLIGFEMKDRFPKVKIFGLLPPDSRFSIVPVSSQNPGGGISYSYALRLSHGIETPSVAQRPLMAFMKETLVQELVAPIDESNRQLFSAGLMEKLKNGGKAHLLSVFSKKFGFGPDGPASLAASSKN